MRLVYFAACVCVALGATSRANGTSQDFLFSADAAWLNWPFAVIWLALGLYAFVWRPE